MAISIEKGIKFFQRLLINFKRKKALKRAGKELVERAARRIEIGRDPFGKKFVPLSPVTVAIKGFDKPLVETGKMKRNYFFKIDKRDLVISNRRKYAIFHQLGGKIPQRLVLSSKVDSEVVIDAYQEEIIKTLRGFGG